MGSSIPIQASEELHRPAAEPAVCVLGPSRSGTSLTARILALTGLDLGPESGFFPASRSNRDGFWEQAGISGFNETLLTRMGGSWSAPPPLPKGWETSPAIVAEQEAARALLARTFGGRPAGPWGWKDPRCCLTLPFWQRLVPGMRYVICLRNPVDIAASLARRDGFEEGLSHRIWLAYLASALVNTSGRPRMFVAYEEYFADWRGAAARLAEFAGTSSPAVDVEVERAIGEEIGAGLRHHDSCAADVFDRPGFPPEAAQLRLLSELLHATELSVAGRGGERAELESAADLYAARLLSERAPA